MGGVGRHVELLSVQLRCSIGHIKIGIGQRQPVDVRGQRGINRERHWHPLALTRRECLVVETKALRLRSEEHTSELQSLMRISYAVFCLLKNKPHAPNYIKAT